MAAAKQELRLRIRSIRDAIPPDQAQRAAEAAARHLLALPAAAGARVVALYAPTRGELDTGPAAELLRARGVTLAYPRILRRGRRLAFHRLEHAGELEPGCFGISEPARAAPRVPVERIDLFVVPGLAFGEDGARLGWGKGHYDATLDRSRTAARIGYAFDCQIVDDLPRSPTDAPMHYLVTETGARACDPTPPDPRLPEED